MIDLNLLNPSIIWNIFHAIMIPPQQTFYDKMEEFIVKNDSTNTTGSKIFELLNKTQPTFIEKLDYTSQNQTIGEQIISILSQNEKTLLSQLLDLMKPSVIFMFNYLLIPTIVDWFSYYEGYQKKSERHRNNVFKQFIFIMIASVFIPLTNHESIQGFLSESQNYSRDNIEKTNEWLSNNLLRIADYFLKYLIQCTFLSNMIGFLDIPHHMYMYMKRVFSKYSSEQLDDWYFDLGYQYAFSISIFVIGFVFSVSAPLLSIFGFLFFAIKYLVDKYNLTQVYTNEFDSNGVMAQSTWKYIAFGIFLFQLTMCGFINLIFNNTKEIFIASLIVIGGEIFYLMVFKTFSTSELRDAFHEIEQEAEKQFRLTKDLNKGTLCKFSPIQVEKIKKAYQHPFERYEEMQNAQKLNTKFKRELEQQRANNESMILTKQLSELPSMGRAVSKRSTVHRRKSQFLARNAIN